MNSAALLWAPVFVAVITAVSAVVTVLITGRANRYLELQKSDANRALEQQKYDTDAKLERQKFESSLILQSIATGDQASAQKNLAFLVNLGFLPDPEGKIKQLVERPADTPVLPARGPTPWTQNPEGAGTTPLQRAINRLKNRDALPQQGDIDPNFTLDAVLQPGDDEDRFDSQRAGTLNAFVVRVAAGGVTSSNFKSTDPAMRDTHIYLGADPKAPRNKCVLAVVSPLIRNRMQERGIDWSTAVLQQALTGKRVEITGWLMFNLMHVRHAENTNPGNSRNWRATCWELHPVTDIKDAADSNS